MAKPKKTRSGAESPKPAPVAPKRTSWIVPVAAVAVLAVAIAAVLAYVNRGGEPGAAAPATAPATGSLPATQPATPAGAPGAPAMETMEVAKAVVFTTEIYYGEKIPTVAQAVSQIERRSKPDDGNGRTFAILDADGWPTGDGKLHIQMHISSEKPGIGSLVYRPTGEVLWNARIVGAPAPALKELKVLVDDGAGKTLTVDGSTNPPSVLEATVKETGQPVAQIWPDGQERELTFIFSACGCPVKVMARREGNRTVRVASKRLDGSARTPDLPVMFPDDPAAVSTISRLMRW